MVVFLNGSLTGGASTGAIGVTSTAAADAAAGLRIGVLSTEDQFYSLLAERPFMRPKYFTGDFHVPVLIVASLIFLTVLMWFDCLRLSIEYSMININSTYKQVLSYLTFCLVVSVIFIGVILLIVKFWIK